MQDHRELYFRVREPFGLFFVDFVTESSLGEGWEAAASWCLLLSDTPLAAPCLQVPQGPGPLQGHRPDQAERDGWQGGDRLS